MKKVYAGLGVVLIIWAVQAYYLLQVMRLEQKLHTVKIDLENNVKTLDRKVMEYDKKIDLTAIKKDMETHQNMKMAEEIHFFEIKE